MGQKSILRSTHWSFREPYFETLRDFEIALAKYNDSNPGWTQRRMRYPVSEVGVVVYVHFWKTTSDGEDVEIDRAITFGRGRISGLALLFGLHINLAGEFENVDAHYFEGLVFDDVDAATGKYRYRLALGS